MGVAWGAGRAAGGACGRLGAIRTRGIWRTFLREPAKPSSRADRPRLDSAEDNDTAVHPRAPKGGRKPADKLVTCNALSGSCEIYLCRASR